MRTANQPDTSDQPFPVARIAAGWTRPLSRFVVAIHAVLVAATVVSVTYASVLFLRAAWRYQPPRLPATMEQVDWSSPESSEYCLACHKPVGPAMAGLDVEHGHPQNVSLDDSQIQAVADMGTIAGPKGTLICMSCHILCEQPAGAYMLADTLANGRFCERCHPGHYARGTPHDLRTSAPTECNRLDQTAAEGGPCSTCHLAHRYARDFEPCTHDPDGRCTTCHEIHRCAEKHARPTMEHPEARCLECHDPHDMSHGEFLKGPIAELCITCHDEYAGGAAVGMHPLGTMDRVVPQELIEAGAQVQSGSRELTCAVCHSTHAADHQPLLMLDPDSNRLCLACHEDKYGETSHGGATPRHGQSPILTAEQREVIDDWEARVGPNGELLCVSCHRVHDAKSKVALLTFQPKYGETCSACHPHHDDLFGTSHDLRTNFPDEKNLADMTPSEHGACSACHLAHGFARQTTAAPGDPSGQCVSCHQADQCGQARLVEGTDHPDTKCTDCHNPHERRFGNYLALAEPDLCVECHAEQARLVGGPHDRTTNAVAWPDSAPTAQGLCLPCHLPHGGERADLFRLRGPNPVGNHDDVCLVCHADVAWNTPTGLAAIHPCEVSPTQNKVELALVPKDDEGNMRIGCRTCHDPHGGPNPIHLARVSPDQPTESLCIHCHAEKKYIKHTGHSAESLMRFGFDVDSCKPCHAMHANPDGTWGQMLSPRFLMESCEAVTEQGAACVPCLACHHAQGPAPVREVATHPQKEMWNIIAPDAPGYLPLFNAAGHVDPQGMVVCRTCHLSHGRLDLLQRVAEKQPLSHAEHSAIRTQLRPFIAPNICTECHGLEARLRFLFFHDPERRAFPRQDPTEQQRHLPRQSVSDS